jgi:Acetyltransferase (GNAT) domain
MIAEINIRYLPHQQIDKPKWDKCIDAAGNGLIYAYSFYLDHMAKHWDALVLNDYECVMPLTWNMKYGIRYLYQPFLCAQLGLFGNNLDAGLLSEFLRAIPQKFVYWDFLLNHGNVFSLPDFDLTLRSNYVLDLNKPYEELYKSYRENIRRNINKARQLGCYEKKDIEAEKVIELAVQQMQTFAKPKMNDFENFKRLYDILHKQGKAFTYGLFSQQNELQASCIFFFSHSRAYYILVGNHPDGKTIGASHALIDTFIKDHAGKNLKLDFEGSDIHNLAFFYSSFGAVEEKYSSIKLNKLPSWARWLKK